ncbi:MAG TPA: hypothetical protein PL110_03265 [Candidatus Eremiobacteraeota bacterium]|nr:MAG: hypothetical protein BWY64_03919 [bacterium ADurb.Bin363]HPZ07107.1 hypothetical protein [Candidatus Eremiobacteraeota bacterium]
MAEKKVISQLLSNVKGAIAGIIISLKGEEIEVNTRKTITDPGFVRGELAIIMKVANSLAEDLKMGPVREVIISFDTYSIISLMIRDNYALILFMDDSGSLGLARKKMGAVIPDLEKDLYSE